MRNRHILPVVVTLGLLVAAAPLFAHHANAVFDTTKTVTVKGAVTEWFWANPHCLLRFDVTDDSGQVAHWVGETQAPINMIGNGWRRDSFKAGDYQRAEEEAGRALELAPDNPSIRRLLDALRDHLQFPRGTLSAQRSPERPEEPELK